MEVSRENLVMCSIRYWVVGFDRQQKVAWNFLCTWFPPYHWTSAVFGELTISCHCLAIRLHVSLLEISSKPVHILVIRQQSMSLSSEEVVVPNTEYCHQHWNIVLQSGFLEMVIHEMCARK